MYGKGGWPDRIPLVPRPLRQRNAIPDGKGTNASLSQNNINTSALSASNTMVNTSWVDFRQHQSLSAVARGSSSDGSFGLHSSSCQHFSPSEDATAYDTTRFADFADWLPGADGQSGSPPQGALSTGAHGSEFR